MLIETNRHFVDKNVTAFEFSVRLKREEMCMVAPYFFHISHLSPNNVHKTVQS